MYSKIYEFKDRSFRYNEVSCSLEWVLETDGKFQVINSYDLPFANWEANPEFQVYLVNKNIESFKNSRMPQTKPIEM